jgi:flavin reductase (DIM6/NTAB) family NADH-FMN oxidoreductase RutF
MSHVQIAPAILYWGTPVVLITTKNPDGTPNIGPMSSAWWIGTNCVLGLDATSQTTANILRTRECVLNLADDSPGMANAVNILARTTGTNPVPPSKKVRGYVTDKDKFATAGLTPLPSTQVSTPGILDCPVVMEARLAISHDMFPGKPFQGGVLAIEVEVVSTRIRPQLKLEGHENRVDAEKWKPMIMMFSDLFGLRDGKLKHSRLADIEEELYRLPKLPPGLQRRRSSVTEMALGGQIVDLEEPEEQAVE